MFNVTGQRLEKVPSHSRSRQLKGASHVYALYPRSSGKHCANRRGRCHSDCKPDRRGRRLQPRQRAEGLAAIGAGFDGARDDQERRHESPEQFSLDATAYFNGIFKRADAQNLHVDATYTNTNGPQIVITASAAVKTMFLNIAGHRNTANRGDRDDHVVVEQCASARRTRARQYRLDGPERQARGAEDRDA